jgi:hypothetical protein
MRWPDRIEAGTISDRMAATIDILPTIAAITGASLPELTIDGVDILPLLEGAPDANPRDQLFFYYGRELRGVREGRWKRVYRHRTRSYVGVEPGMDGVPGPYAHPTVPDALYDLENDPAETTDVSAEHPGIVRRLDALAEQARAALGDRLTDRVGSEVRPPGRREARPVETVEHLARGAVVTLAAPPNPQYPGKGAESLVDGDLASSDHHDGYWIGFEGTDLEAVIDLGEMKEVRRIGLSCLRSQGSWIFFPRVVEFALSDDGRSWTRERRVPVGLVRNAPLEKRRIETEIGPVRTRYVRVRATNLGRCPAWHPGDGGRAWLFVDEIVVR